MLTKRKKPEEEAQQPRLSNGSKQKNGWARRVPGTIPMWVHLVPLGGDLKLNRFLGRFGGRISDMKRRRKRGVHTRVGRLILRQCVALSLILMMSRKMRGEE